MESLKRNILFTFMIALSCSSSFAQADFFAKKEIIKLKIKAPLQKLFDLRQGLDKNNFFKIKDTSISGFIFIADHPAIPIDIRMRGFTSFFHCPFPKLEIKFTDKKMIQDTAFAGIKKLDLGTHCGSKDADASSVDHWFYSMIHNHREALIYDWLNILGIPSLHSRMAWVTYEDNSDDKNIVTTQAEAFFLESLSAFLKDNQAIEIRAQTDYRKQQDEAQQDASVKYLYKSLADSPKIDNLSLARVALFEGLIENSDWRLENDYEIWNVKIIEQNNKWIVVPMDFNLSMIVQQTPIALFSKILKQKYFDLASDEQKKLLVKNYLDHKIEMYKAIERLENDVDGQANFKAMLDAWFQYLQTMNFAKP